MAQYETNCKHKRNNNTRDCNDDYIEPKSKFNCTDNKRKNIKNGFVIDDIAVISTVLKSNYLEEPSELSFQ